MHRREKAEYGREETFSPWETYSDLYCGLLLVFVLLFFFAIYQYIDARETNDADTAQLQASMQEEQDTVLAIYKAELEEQEAAYQEAEDELESQQTVLSIMRTELEEKSALLETKESELDAQEAVLSEQSIQLANQQTILEEQQSLLDEQSAQLEAQQAVVEEQQTQLEEQAEQIEQIVGIRSRLISEVNMELNANGIQVQADLTTGAIIFESSVLFERNSSELSQEGEEFLRQFLPVYLDTLLQPDFLDYIAEVIIEGHTENSGDYLTSLELSQQRAYSVAAYFLDNSCDFLDADTVNLLKTLVTANGCAYKDPVYQEDGTIDSEASRRVELKFRLKDQEMIEELDELLNKQEGTVGE